MRRRQRLGGAQRQGGVLGVQLQGGLERARRLVGLLSAGTGAGRGKGKPCDASRAGLPLDTPVLCNVSAPLLLPVLHSAKLLAASASQHTPATHVCQRLLTPWLATRRPAASGARPTWILRNASPSMTNES